MIFISGKSLKGVGRPGSKGIQSCLDWKEEYLKRRSKSAGYGKPSGLLFPAIKILSVLCACIFLLFMVSRVIADPRSDLSITDKVDDKYSREAVEKSERVFNAFRKKDKEELKTLAYRLDVFGIRDCESVFGKFESSPDFRLASVRSPKTDPNLYYVSVPSGGGLQTQFSMRNLNGNLVFEGICLNQK